MRIDIHSIYFSFACLLLSVLPTFGQVPDSLAIDVTRIDSLTETSIYKVDSIVARFQQSGDSLQNVYKNKMQSLDLAKKGFQSKIDSLTNLKIPSEKVTQQLDSVTNLYNAKMEEYNQKFEALKSRTVDKVNAIPLPPELQRPLGRLQNSISQYSLPDLSTNFSTGLNVSEITSLPKIELPTLSKQLNIPDKFADLSTDLNGINRYTSQLSQYSGQAKDLVNGNVGNLDNVEKSFETKLMNMDGSEQLVEGQKFFNDSKQLLTDSAAMANKAKEMLMEQVSGQMENHFAGKEQILQDAMGKMSKLKNRYSEVKSYAELPAKLPNPLKGKPFIERLLPVINFQIQKTNNILVDVNPLLIYKISPRLSAGGGWNQRFAFDNWNLVGASEVYGPRALFEVKWTKGLFFLLNPELMNTAIPVHSPNSPVVLDASHREWVPSWFVGIKKEFRVAKAINGRTDVLYNLYDPENSSPYANKVSIRFGFEFPLKKNSKKN